MIFATVQPLEKYDIMCEGQQAGLYSTYFGRSPVLFNLITRASLIPFQFEPFNNGKKHFFMIDNDDMYEETLPQLVGGKTVERLCCDLNPIQMLEFFTEHPDDLPALKLTEYWSNKVSLLLSVMKARALQWRRYQRRELARSGNVIQAQFGSLLVPAEEKFLSMMNIYHRDYKEAVG